MEEKKDILNNLNKRKKPNIPEGFFDTFSDDLIAKITENEVGLDNFSKTNKPDVPKGFFKNFSVNVKHEKPTTEESPAKIIKIKIAGFVSAVAACMLIMFYVMPNETSKITPDTAENSTTDPMITLTNDDFLAFVEEDDIVNYLLENEDISLEEETPIMSNYNEDDVFYFLEKDIETLYLEEL